MTGVAPRRVRSVHLAASSDALVQRGAIVLEDALHTATFPEGAGARLLLVRTLDVGTFYTSRSAASLSLVVESEMQRVAVRAVYADEPAAGAADVVFFHDPIDALTKLALRLARGGDTSAWYWPLAVRRWRRDLSRDEGLRVAIDEAMQGEGGAYGAASVLRILKNARALDPLLAALEPADGTALLGVAGWSRTETVRHLPSTPGRARPASKTRSILSASSVEGVTGLDWGIGDSDLTPWVATLNRWVAEWGGDDDRSVWLATTVLVGIEPGLMLDAALPARGARLASALASRRSEPVVRTEAATNSELARDGNLPSGVVPAAIANGDAAPEIRGAFTEFGGLFFALNVMARLDVGEFLTDHPHFIERGFVGQVLRDLCRQAGAEDVDTVHSAISSTENQNPLGPGGFVVPVTWRHLIADQESWVIGEAQRTLGGRVLRDGANRLTLALWHDGMPQRVLELSGDIPLEQGDVEIADRVDAVTIAVDSWAAAIRLWCHRVAELALEDLIVRPAHLKITRTHLDVWFRLSQADIRVRRAGLDTDPGWVPWFGRVVRFHYGEGLGGRR